MFECEIPCQQAAEHLNCTIAWRFLYPLVFIMLEGIIHIAVGNRKRGANLVVLGGKGAIFFLQPSISLLDVANEK